MEKMEHEDERSVKSISGSDCNFDRQSEVASRQAITRGQVKMPSRRFLLSSCLLDDQTKMSQPHAYTAFKDTGLLRWTKVPEMPVHTVNTGYIMLALLGGIVFHRTGRWSSGRIAEAGSRRVKSRDAAAWCTLFAERAGLEVITPDLRSTPTLYRGTDAC
ncbi:hypothetical protein KQX54_021091 [Cotesia glomerata]|uniref:Uncharacterized protein n=1 Tax=Cotesia glomerata TaxID=32391 RepID=A0AAV7IVA8_COTGL|nr:hypothetical protein KQX54_021091 [Cotesia glomerata]